MKSFSVFLLLAFGVAQGAEPESKESSDLLEATRRDLQELPSLDRGLTPSRPLPESTFQLPPLTPGAPTAKAGDDNKTKLPEPSQGWLLDGLKQAEAKDRSPFRRAPSATERLSSEATRRKLGGTPNPLSNYLQQWLAPQDRRLLGGEKADQTALERAGIRQEEPFRPKLNADPKSPFLESGEHSALPGSRVNPYLTPGPTDESFSLGSVSPTTSPFAARPPLSSLSNSALDQRLYLPDSKATIPALSGSAKAEALPPPTAPLFDERRYFPQLRRF